MFAYISFIWRLGFGVFLESSRAEPQLVRHKTSPVVVITATTAAAVMIAVASDTGWAVC